MHPLLTDRVALITGAGSGIGRATARLFASEGAAVSVVDIRAALATTVAEEIQQAGGRAIGLGVDAADPSAAVEAVSATVRALGGLDVLVNNAGISSGPRTPSDELSLERWDEMMQVNFRSQLLMARAAFPHLARRGGAVVNNASSAALTSTPGSAHYATSKAAIVMLTRCLAAEWGPRGIRVNAVAPGIIDTGFGRRVAEVTQPADPALQARQIRHVPLGRLGTAEDIAGVMLFLASDLAGYVTGETILVDGGLLQMLYPAVNGVVS